MPDEELPKYEHPDEWLSFVYRTGGIGPEQIALTDYPTFMLYMNESEGDGRRILTEIDGMLNNFVPLKKCNCGNTAENISLLYSPKARDQAFGYKTEFSGDLEFGDSGFYCKNCKPGASTMARQFDLWPIKFDTLTLIPAHYSNVNPDAIKKFVYTLNSVFAHAAGWPEGTPIMPKRRGKPKKPTFEEKFAAAEKAHDFVYNLELKTPQRVQPEQFKLF